MSRALTSAPHSTPLSIIIAGAGIGGLTLGNLLRQADSNIKVQIFERDSAVRSRTQGGTLGLKDSGGFVALRRLGRYEEILAVSKPVTQFTVLKHIFASKTSRVFLILQLRRFGMRLPALASEEQRNGSHRSVVVQRPEMPLTSCRPSFHSPPSSMKF